MAYWGYHLMLDVGQCNDNIKSRDQIYNFIKDLVPRIGMVAHGEPIIEYLLPGDPKAGYSLMQLITTSNICAHFIEPDSTAYFDIFSCKEFDIETAVNCVREYFGAGKITTHYLERQA